ncbi:MAG: DNA/RNA helicase domain-containing protein [Planctomycetota bacterium]
MDLDASADDWLVVLEFGLPRLAKRLDLIVVAPACAVVAELKGGSADNVDSGFAQAEEYAFCLRHFHHASHGKRILPVVVSEVDLPDRAARQWDGGVPDERRAQLISWSDFPAFVHAATRSTPGQPTISVENWVVSEYRAHPTILDAARTMFATHSVRELGLTGAGQEELEATTTALIEIVREARERKEHAVAFVTGVPGSGKTLVGLSLVQRLRSELVDDADIQKGCVFLTGNGPLAAILRGALMRDVSARRRREGGRGATAEDKDAVKAFIQEMHRFTHEYTTVGKESAPPEHVLVFDEAQRAWTQEKCIAFSKQRKRDTAAISEPATVLDVLSRQTWAVLVCLVGPGQEIHDGEGGIGTWIDALGMNSRWRVAAPRELGGRSAPPGWHANDQLHLRTSRRSLIGERLSEWVELVLAGDQVSARRVAHQLIQRDMPLGITRSLSGMRTRLRTECLQSHRPALLGSSGALRLRAIGVEPPAFQYTKNVVDVVDWMLKEPEDFRSSHRLEVAMSEFETQGLEVDHAGILWGGDLVWESEGWGAWKLKGPSWKRVPEPGADLVRNKYRVLMTRSRLSLFILVPAADPSDPSQRHSAMESTLGFLVGCGLPEF